MEEEKTPAATEKTTTIKRFKASSLSVNKKFLSQSSDQKLAKILYNGSPRLASLASSSTSSGIPSSAPRLLTGKIGLNNSILNPSGSAASGWAKTPLVTPSPLLSTKSPESNHSSLQLNPSDSEHSHPTGLNGFLHSLSSSPPQNFLPSSNPTPSSSTTTSAAPPPPNPSNPNPPSSSSSPWVKFANSTRTENLSSDFPTAQEVAQHTKLKAQSMAAAVAARDKAVQDRAAASAAYNQQLLQTLDGFRGTHLDPNASHWDEMEDEEDMFGEVVEFGDGTQYKVTEVAAPPTDPVPPSSNGAPSPATTSRNLPSKSSEDPDHLPPFLRARAELKSLFNERIGKFEPYSANKSADKSKDNHPQLQILQRHREGSGDLTGRSPAASSTRLPDSTPKDGSSTQPDRTSAVNPSDSTKPPPAQVTSSSPERSQGGSKTLEVDKQLPPTDSSNDPAKHKKPNLDQLHRTEMTSAAERARKRRQEEEATREAEKERAKLKAMEIEAKLKAAAEAAEAAKAALKKTQTIESSNTNKPSPKLYVRCSSNDVTRHSTERTSPKEKASWRSRAPSHPSEEKPRRETSPSKLPEVETLDSSTLPKKPTMASELSTVRSETKPITTTRPSNRPHPAAPLPSQESSFRSRNENQTPVWKPRIASAAVSHAKSENRPQPNSDEQPSEASVTQQGSTAGVPPSSQPTRRQQPETKFSTSLSDGRQTASHSRQGSIKISTEPGQNMDRPPSPHLPPSSVLKSSFEVWPFKPASTLPSQHTSPNLPGSASRPPPSEKGQGFKLPEMSLLDTVMSRIKVVLEADKEARSKSATALKSSDSLPTTPESSDPKDLPTSPTVKQGFSPKNTETVAGSTTQSSSPPRAVYVAGRPKTLLPRTKTLTQTKELPKEPVDASPAPPKIPDMPNPTPAPSTSALKKTTAVRKAARFDIPPSVESQHSAHLNSPQQAAPKWVNRDPIVFFDATRQERSSSPVPAWKSFTVKLGAVKPKPRLGSHLIKSFWNPFQPAKVNALSWEPHNSRFKNLSREDVIFPKKYRQGILVSHIQLPKHTIASLETRLLSAKNKPHDAGQAGLKNRARSRADETASWRRPVEEKAPSVADSPAPIPPAPSVTVVTKDLAPPTKGAAGSKSPENISTPRRSKSKIPEGCKVAFQKPAHLSTPPATGMFMVNSEITGEGPGFNQPSDQASSPLNDTAGSTSTAIPSTTAGRDSPPPVALTPRSTNITGMSGSKGSTSSWTKSPLAFSVLDSHTKNVWSQPDGQMTAKRVPSGKIENSLEGIADDFPAALPRTLNDFNAEEEPRNPSQYKPSTTAVEIPSAGNLEQNAGSSSTNPDLQSGPNLPDDQVKTNGLVVQPTYMNSPTGPLQYNGNEHPPSNPMHTYPHTNYSSPSNFQVPPGYQLVPIGSLPSTQTTQYPPVPTIYPGQVSAPWSPSLGQVQSNGYASSPQLYSPNTNYPPLVTTPSGYPPQHVHPVGPNQLPGGSGFSRSPGPIAPRGGSRGSGPTGHMNRPSNNEINNFGTPVARNHGSYSPATNKRQPNPGNTMAPPPPGPSYHLPPPGSIVDGPPSSDRGPPPPPGYPDPNFAAPYHPAGFPPPSIHHQQHQPQQHHQQQQLNSFNQVLHHGAGTGGPPTHMVSTGHVHHHAQASVGGPHYQPSGGFHGANGVGPGGVMGVGRAGAPGGYAPQGPPLHHARANSAARILPPPFLGQQLRNSPQLHPPLNPLSGLPLPDHLSASNAGFYPPRR